MNPRSFLRWRWQWAPMGHFVFLFLLTTDDVVRKLEWALFQNIFFWLLLIWILWYWHKGLWSSRQKLGFSLEKIFLRNFLLAKQLSQEEIFWQKGPLRVSTSSRDVGALLGNAAIWFHYTALHYPQHLSISLSHPTTTHSISLICSTVLVHNDWVYFSQCDYNFCNTPLCIPPNICPYYSSPAPYFCSTIFH